MVLEVRNLVHRLRERAKENQLFWKFLFFSREGGGSTRILGPDVICTEGGGSSQKVWVSPRLFRTTVLGRFWDQKKFLFSLA